MKIVFAIFGIGFCIFSHELGHFLAAKWLGLHVDAFSIGFKAIWKKKYKGVEYRIGCIPVGGYCEIPQIDAADEKPKSADGTELTRATPCAKIVTAAAGPMFNIISGALLACIIWVWGMPQDTPKMRAITVRDIDVKGPEYAAGLRKGDRIVKLNGKPFFCTWARFTEQLIYINGEIELTVARDNKERPVRYIPRENPNAPVKLKNEHLPYPFFEPRIPIELAPKSGGAAEKAGLKAGDKIIKINGMVVGTDDPDKIDFQDFMNLRDRSQGKPLHFILLRGDQPVEIEVVPHRIAGLKGDADYYLIGIGFHQDEKHRLEIESLFRGGAAERAGVLPGDKILELDGEVPKSNLAFSKRIRQGKGKPVKLKLQRGEKVVEVEFAPDKYTVTTIDADFPMDHPSPWRQFVSTLNGSYKALRGISVTIGNKLGITKKNAQIKPQHLSGPVGMANVLTSNVHIHMGYREFSALIFWLVMISFALAIFNLLPLPVLDGGHIFFGCVELVIRRPLPVRVVKVLYITFAVLLIMLMVYATFNDARRIYNNNRRTAPAAEKTKK